MDKVAKRTYRKDVAMNRYIAVIFVIVVQCNAKQDFLFGKFPDGFEWGITSSEDFIENGKYNTYCKFTTNFFSAMHLLCDPSYACC